jgi:16S rRNA (uracil1498-N3)-methyltransferase
VTLGKRDAQVRVESTEALGNESPLRITLLQGIARGEKMDLILQKATELGVQAVVPVNAERTEVKLDAARAEKRLAHWRSVVVSACGQSGRARVPEVAAPQGVQEAARAMPADALKLTLDPLGEHRLSTLDAAPRWRGDRDRTGRRLVAARPSGAGGGRFPGVAVGAADPAH